jgi:hypothetical protein
MEGCLGRFLGATESGRRSTCSGRIARTDTSDRTYSLGESAPSSMPRAITPPARLLLVSARARTPVLTATRHRPCQGRRRPARDSTGSAVRDHRCRRLSRRGQRALWLGVAACRLEGHREDRTRARRRAAFIDVTVIDVTVTACRPDRPLHRLQSIWCGRRRSPDRCRGTSPLSDR